MTEIDVIRAWKDESYRNRLSAEEQAALPDNPAGLVELHDSDLVEADGGTTWACATITATIALTVTFCSPSGTLCGSCNWGTHACC